MACQTLVTIWVPPDGAPARPRITSRESAAVAGPGAKATDDLLERIARTTVAAWGQYASRVGGRVVVDAGLTFVVGTHPTPIIINTVFRTDPSVAPLGLFARSQAFYKAIGHRFTMLTSDHVDADLNEAAKASGWLMAIEVPAMVCRTAVPDRPLPAGASIRRADPMADIDAFRAVVREGFASDEDEIAAADTVFSSPAALDMPDTVAVIASIEGRDAAAAMVNVIDRMGYVGWVGTLPAFRRRGLGELVSRAATNAAFERGADIVALEASSMALPLYSKMGYETVGMSTGSGCHPPTDRRPPATGIVRLTRLSSIGCQHPSDVHERHAASDPREGSPMTASTAPSTSRPPGDLDDTAVADLRKSFDGEIVQPTDSGYDMARRAWNGMVDKHPALVVRPRGTADVVAVIGFARTHGLELAVRCGGHGTSGQSVTDSGIVIDLGLMRGVRVDRAARRAWVQGGCLLADVDREAQLHGLATTGGVVSHTGVGGLTLGGGYGYLARRFGLACDNVLSAEVVTASGEVLVASPDQNEDLYWGIRGGGGNFGVVTEFEFQLHPFGPEILSVDLAYPIDRGAAAIRAACTRPRPPDAVVSGDASIVTARPSPMLPEAFHGQSVVWCRTPMRTTSRKASACCPG